MTTTVNINSSLKINVTPIESGASGGILFQKSDGKLGQSSNLHWDQTNSRLSIGQGTSPSARLDVRSQGALSTDLAFSVRNSSDTFNQFDIQGNSVFNFRMSNTSTTSAKGINLLGTNEDVLISSRAFNTEVSARIGFEARSVNNGFYAGLFADYGGALVSSSAGVLTYSGAARMNFLNISNNTTGWAFLHTSSQIGSVSNTVFAIYPTNAQSGGGTLALGTTLGTTVSSMPATTYGRNTFFIANGTAPSTTGANAFGLYSADITAGNAAPHFRTENGSVIRLFRGAALTVSDGTLGNAVTRIAELEARLQAHGLIA